MKYKIAVIGSGSWGTAVACELAKNKHNVSLWTRRCEVCDAINTKHENIAHLPGYTLPSSLQATCDMGRACKDKGFRCFRRCSFKDCF